MDSTHHFASSERQERARQRRAEVAEERKAAGLPTTKTPVEKLAEKPKSLRLAVNAMCCVCVGGPEEARWRYTIRDCTAPTCPLFNVRPHQNAGRGVDDDEALEDEVESAIEHVDDPLEGIGL